MSAASEPLGAVQRWMLEALVEPGKVDRQEIADIFLPGSHLDAAGCLAIYQRSYILRLQKCLAEQFPATRHALGDALFDDFAEAYLGACPSDSYTLYELGRRFPAWLEESRPDREFEEDGRESWIDFMVDLAHYERELFRLFDAPGYEGRAWPGAEADDRALILQPCLMLLEYRYPVAWYYHEVRAGKSPGFPPPSRSHLVLLRRDYQTSTYPVSPLHYRFLTTLQEHGSVGFALADIATWSHRPLEEVTRSWAAEVRRPWIAAGFFVARGDAPTSAAGPTPSRNPDPSR